MNIEHALIELRSYVELNRYQGYDPYDTLNSFIPFSKMGKWIPALAIQFQKRNPVNIRPLLGIKKGYNPKGMGLFLKAYCLLYEKTKEVKYKERAEFIFNWLKNNYSKGYSGNAWGYNFDWANPDGNLKAYTPSVVVTSFVIDGVFEYCRLFKNDEAKAMVLSAADYITDDLPITKLDQGISIAYTHQSKGCCYNASLLGAETLAKAYFLTQDSRYLDIAHQAVDYVLSMQKEDGAWYYSYNPEKKTERKQIDFHQGFILMSLNQYLKYADKKRPEIEEAIRKGLRFYKTHQFFEDGRSKWRLPKEWPVEIHNQAQGIITFSELSHYDASYQGFAAQIANYTIDNMQDNKGFFYYQKYKFYTNKIPYIRWSQAWMMLALATLKDGNS
jgi:hypothetical protein